MHKFERYEKDRFIDIELRKVKKGDRIRYKDIPDKIFIAEEDSFLGDNGFYQVVGIPEENYDIHIESKKDET